MGLRRVFAEAVFQRQAAGVLDLADGFCWQAVRERDLALLDEMAERHPMRERPRVAPSHTRTAEQAW